MLAIHCSMNLLRNVKNGLSCVVLYVYTYFGFLHNLLAEKYLRRISFGFNWNYLVGVFCSYIRKSIVWFIDFHCWEMIPIRVITGSLLLHAANKVVVCGIRMDDQYVVQVMTYVTNVVFETSLSKHMFIRVCLEKITNPILCACILL